MQMNHFWLILDIFLNKYSGTGFTNLVVTGEEFNFPYINWNLGCPIVSDPETVEFCNVLGHFFLLQKNHHVTRDTSNPSTNGNILDLVLTNNEYLIKYALVHTNAFDSDHHPLTLSSYMLRKQGHKMLDVKFIKRFQINPASGPLFTTA